MNRWLKTGGLNRVCDPLQKEHLGRIKLEAGLMDRPSVQGPPGGTGARNKTDPRPSARPAGAGPPRGHRVAAEARTPVTCSPSPGHAHEEPEDRKLLRRLGAQREPLPLLLDRASEGNETRQLARRLGIDPVGPPRTTRLGAWEDDRQLAKRRNEVKQLIRRLKRVHRLFSRFEKLDVICLGFIVFALIFDARR